MIQFSPHDPMKESYRDPFLQMRKLRLREGQLLAQGSRDVAGLSPNPGLCLQSPPFKPLPSLGPGTFLPSKAGIIRKGGGKRWHSSWWH